MNDSSRIDERLLKWEELRAAGQSLTPEDLCRDCPELIPDIRRRINALRSLDKLLGARDDSQTTDYVAGADALDTPRGGPIRMEAHYTVVRTHARGGLGEVVLVRDELLNRHVALKRMQGPAAHGGLRRARFLREAEITAQLEHPGIVPVHCLGEDETQGPYYSMRFVKGETLAHAIATFHADATALATNGRQFRQLLGRFISVCNTVAFAHSKGVIHRDLKPANIMIGEFGETLVVDWGLAKRLDELTAPTSDIAAATEETTDSSPDTQRDQLTRIGTAMGTPAYMSPEQAHGDTHRLGPLSDIYSLGATLYALLTGEPPAGIRQVDGFVKRMRDGALVPPRQLRSDVPAALDAICRKALAFHPEGRYASALELARDLENWLADEPVSVWRDSLGTRLRRWTKRHRTLATAVAAIGVACVVGAVAISLVTTRANEQLRIAHSQEQESRRLADRQSDLAMRSLQSVTFDIQRKLQHVPAAHTVRRRLLETALQGLNEVAVGLDRQTQIDLGLVAAHRDLGDVLLEVGTGGVAGGIDAARAQYERAYAVAQRLSRSSPDDGETQRQLALCLHRLGNLESAAGSADPARVHYDDALAVLNRLRDRDPADHAALRSISVTEILIGDLALKNGSLEEAGSHFQRALEIREEQAASGVGDPELERDLIVCRNKVGEYFLRTGEVRRAEEHFLRSLESSQARADRAPDDFEALFDLSNSLFKLGNIQSTLGAIERAADYHSQSLVISERRLALDPSNATAQRDVLESLLTMASVMRRLRKNADAEAHLVRATAMGDQMIANDPSDQRGQRNIAYAHADLGDLVLARQPGDEALRRYQQCLSIMRELAASDPAAPRRQSDVAYGLAKMGDGLLALQRLDEALEHYTQALRIHRERAEANPADVNVQRNLAAFLQRIGVACKKCGRLDTAQEYYTEALQVAEGITKRSPENINAQVLVITLLHSLGLLEEARNRPVEARQCYDRGLALARQLVEVGKLKGEDATWVEYLEKQIREMKNSP